VAAFGASWGPDPHEPGRPLAIRRVCAAKVVGVADPDRGANRRGSARAAGCRACTRRARPAGMDEISPHGMTDVWEVKDGAVRTWQIDPNASGSASKTWQSCRAGSRRPTRSGSSAFLGNGSADPSGLAAVLLNAGAAIYVAGIAGSLAEGIGRAREVVASGAARAALDRLRKATASIS